MQAKVYVQKTKIKVFYAVLVFLFLLPLSVLARDIAPVVPGEWLEKNLSSPGMVIIDIRKVEDYKAGHVPNSVSAFYGSWIAKRNDNTNELLESDDLFDLLGSLGINANAKVVIVGSTADPVLQCFRTRVAWTLIYAGVKNVALLDGGFEKWQKDKRAVSTDVTKAAEVECKGNLQKDVNLSKEQLLAGLGKAIVVDTRPADFFFGVAKAPTVVKAGHIKGAVCLPSPGWIMDSEGMMKKTEELAAIAEGVVGSDHAKEIMTYCNTGVYASGWWFFLREVLGYKDVKLYDGSMEELAKDPNAPILKYTWK
jgi:thiosulfate/3-mercaptopyruvate sulfurtransferase